MEPKTEAPAAAPTRRNTLWLRVIATAGALALVLGAVGGVWMSQRQDSELAEAARRAFHSGDRAAADAAVDRWLAVRPDAGEAHMLRARLRLAERKPQQAIEALARAGELGYAPIESAAIGAVVKADMGDVATAEPILARALEYSREPLPEVAEALTRIHFSKFRLDLAERAIARWMKDDPKAAGPYLARVEIARRSDADASVLIQDYEEALRRDPNLDAARLGLAEQLRAAHRFDEAAETYAAYIKRMPKDVEGYIGAGKTAVDRGDLEAAKRHFDQAIRVAPDDTVALSERALIDIRNGEFAAARDRLKKVIAIDPYDPEVRYSLARALRMTGDEAGAKEQSATAARLREEHKRMSDIRGELVRRPTDVDLKFEAAEWLLTHGHEEEGLAWAQQVLGAQPSHAKMNRVLAEYYTKKGDLGRANYHRLQLDPLGNKAP